MKTMSYLLNLTLLVVCTQFVFADNANDGSKQIYISFEDAQEALPDKELPRITDPFQLNPKTNYKRHHHVRSDHPQRDNH